MRIVSLLASGTEMVCALGLGEQLVGISHECDYPPEALTRPRVSRPRFDPAGLDSGAIDAAVRQAMSTHGSVYELDPDLLRTLAPDLLLTQAVCEVCAVPTSLAQEAAEVLEGRARVLSLDAHRVEDVLRCVVQVAEAAGVAERGERYADALQDRLQRVADAVGGHPWPRVLALEWLDPPFVPGHWTPEMVDLAGGECLWGDAGRPSRQVSWDDLGGLDPDVLLVMPCGYDLPRARADADRSADRLSAVAERAVAEGRAFVVDGSAYFNRSGPRIADGVEILGAVLHPAIFPEGPGDERAAAWRPALLEGERRGAG